ncbi:MAG TPA: deoxyribodipyrimidine photo-lyase [Acidimicrobiales bacterium]|nr:deoxyribodipyrimidine photo-lyase [Acidimicrobiales bacterium]
MAAPPSPGSTGTAVVWFRRDLRLSDHPALSAALARFDRVIPLFIWDPVLVAASGPSRLAFLSGCVKSLGDSLRGQLVIRSGQPERMVVEAAAATGAGSVFVTADFGPYGSERDGRVASALSEQGAELVGVDSPYAVEPGSLMTSTGTPFQVFSPFARAWRAHGWPAPDGRPDLRRVDRGGLADGESPGHLTASAALPVSGEEAAHDRLDAFLRHDADRYGRERDRPDLDSTSRLSPYLRFGCLHPRQILHRLAPGHAGHDRFETELCWREFYSDVLWHRPDSARRAYRPEWREFPSDHGGDADERFRAWTEGRTGYPIVDAGMRQLLAEGWLPNRVRMITASFLVKDLHLDWRRGARWYMRHLVDGDLASNQLNWQWVAGSGNDAAPYFRVFNPVTQGRKFDPQGDYVRRWLPELSSVPTAHVHEPWKSEVPPAAYPAPIVEHAVERQEALARYGRLRR